MTRRHRHREEAPCRRRQRLEIHPLSHRTLGTSGWWKGKEPSALEPWRERGPVNTLTLDCKLTGLQ